MPEDAFVDIESHELARRGLNGLSVDHDPILNAPAAEEIERRTR